MLTVALTILALGVFYMALSFSNLASAVSSLESAVSNAVSSIGSGSGNDTANQATVDTLTSRVQAATDALNGAVTPSAPAGSSGSASA